MKNIRKSATCCYCGANTILTLTGTTHHALQCASCAAPLRRMKSLRKDHVIDPFTVRGKQTQYKDKPKERYKSRKKKKSIAHRLFDVAEDIFDIFD